jgi:hypothetical protein
MALRLQRHFKHYCHQFQKLFSSVGLTSVRNSTVSSGQPLQNNMPIQLKFTLQIKSTTFALVLQAVHLLLVGYLLKLLHLQLLACLWY